MLSTQVPCDFKHDAPMYQVWVVWCFNNLGAGLREHLHKGNSQRSPCETIALCLKINRALRIDIKSEQLQCSGVVDSHPFFNRHFPLPPEQASPVGCPISKEYQNLIAKAHQACYTAEKPSRLRILLC